MNNSKLRKMVNVISRDKQSNPLAFKVMSTDVKIVDSDRFNRHLVLKFRYSWLVPSDTLNRIWNTHRELSIRVQFALPLRLLALIFFFFSSIYFYYYFFFPNRYQFLNKWNTEWVLYRIGSLIHEYLWAALHKYSCFNNWRCEFDWWKDANNARPKTKTNKLTHTHTHTHTHKWWKIKC